MNYIGLLFCISIILQSLYFASIQDQGTIGFSSRPYGNWTQRALRQEWYITIPLFSKRRMAWKSLIVIDGNGFIYCYRNMQHSLSDVKYYYKIFQFKLLPSVITNSAVLESRSTMWRNTSFIHQPFPYTIHLPTVLTVSPTLPLTSHTDASSHT